MLHVFVIPHVQTQSNRVCNSLVILLSLMLPRDHFVSRFFKFQLVYNTYGLPTLTSFERVNALPPFDVICSYLMYEI
jgi:hypothetical protein